LEDKLIGIKYRQENNSAGKEQNNIENEKNLIIKEEIKQDDYLPNNIIIKELHTSIFYQNNNNNIEEKQKNIFWLFIKDRLDFFEFPPFIKYIFHNLCGKNRLYLYLFFYRIIFSLDSSLCQKNILIKIIFHIIWY